MTIRIWQSFACNNSSNYRVVGRFASAKAAANAELEMRAFFADPEPMLERVTRPGATPDAELAAKYNLLLDIQAWVDADHPPYADETIELGTSEDVLVAYHPYCLGLPPAVKEYLRMTGAHHIEQRTGAPTISLLFARSTALDDELAELFQRIDAAAPDTRSIAMPWGKSLGDATYFRDAQTVGLYARIEPSDLPACRRWFAERGATPVMRICEYADEARFELIAAARCTSCAGPLEYLDPRLHDIESPQLLCRPCGGLYDLAAFAPV